MLLPAALARDAARLAPSTAAVSASGQQPYGQEIKASLEQEHFSEAKQMTLNALRSHRNDPALWFYLGVSCNGLNQVEEAIAAFETAHKLAPSQADVDFDLGLLYWRKGDIAKARDAYSRGLAKKPDDPSALENYALLLMKTGESEKAIQPLLLLKKLDANSLSTRVSLVDCYVKIRKHQAAQLEVSELLKLHSAGFEEQTKLAAILIEDGDLELAEQVLHSSLEANPAQPKAYAALGLILLQQKRFKEAAGAFETAARLEPSSAEYAMAFANALVLWNRPNTLLAFLSSVQTQFGNLPEYQHKLAFAYYGLGQFSNAVRILQNLLRSNPPRQDQIYFLLANAYVGMGKLDDSETAFRKAIELNPKEALYYESYATMLRKQGPDRVDDALRELQDAVHLAPQDPALLLQLGLCYEAKGDAKEALAPLEAAVRRQPDSLPAHVALGRVYFKLGRKTEGEAEKKSIRALEATQQKKQIGAQDPAEGGSGAARS
jgi:tetratricopeptide (TPR) repeat protein